MQYPYPASAHPPRDRHGAIPATPAGTRQPGGARHPARTLRT